jgi:hypothetical protein
VLFIMLRMVRDGGWGMYRIVVRCFESDKAAKLSNPSPSKYSLMIVTSSLYQSKRDQVSVSGDSMRTKDLSTENQRGCKRTDY